MHMILDGNAIDLIIYDFDGVMTDNCAIVDEFGHESVIVNRSDGLAVKLIRAKGIEQLIVSTEGNAVVGVRADKLGIPAIQSVDDKRGTVVRHLESNSIDPSRVIYVGNDINDREAMGYVGWPICPADAHDQIKSISRIVLKTEGGQGVVRELLDRLE